MYIKKKTTRAWIVIPMTEGAPACMKEEDILDVVSYTMGREKMIK